MSADSQHPDLPGPAAPEGGPPSARAARGLTAPVRWLLRLLRVLMVVVAALVVGVAAFALFPPSELLRRAGLVIARRVLNHEHLDLRSLRISPLRGIELEGLWLGPPAGYAWPLFTLKRVAARWDLGELKRGELRLEALEVERPLLRVEERNGKLSWLAFLEGLPKSEPKPEEKGEPPDLRVWIDRVAVVGIGALVDDGKQRLVLDGLQVGAAGLYSKKRTHLDVAVRIEERREGQPNLALLLPAEAGQKRLGGRFRLGLGLDVAVEGLLKPRAELDLRTSLRTVEIRAPWPLQPVALDVGVAAAADLGADRARLEELKLGFNGSELLKLSAAVAGVQAPRSVRARVEKLELPLDKLAPYIKAVLPALEVGGEVLVRDLALSGELEALKQKVLPRLSGLIETRKLRARFAPRGKPASEARDLDLVCALRSAGPEARTVQRPEAIAAALPSLAAQPGAAVPAGPSPPLLVETRLRLASARAAGAEVRGLEVRLAAGLDLQGVTPHGFASQLSVGLSSARYRHPKLGALEVGAKTSLRVQGDLARKSVSLERLDLALGDFLRAHLSATAQDFGKRHFSADLTLEPMRVERLLAQVPAPLRAGLGRMRLTGGLGLRAKVSGRAPAPRTPPLRLPLELDARVALSDLKLDDPDRKLYLDRLGGELRVQGKPSDLRISQTLEVGSLRKPDQRLTVTKISVPLSVHILPSQVVARIGTTLGALKHEGLGLSSEGAGVEVDVKASLPLERALEGRPFSPGATSVKVALRSPGMRLAQPGNQLAVRGLRGSVEVSYDGQRKELTVAKVGLDAASVRHAQQGALLENVELRSRAGLQGPRLQLPLPFSADELTPRGLLALLQRVSAGLDLRVGRLALRGVLDQPLRDSQVQLEAGLGADQRLELRKLTLRVPGRGLKVELSGRVGELLSLGIGPIPPFDVQVKVDLDNPVTHDSRRALLVAPNLKVAGRLGVDLRARRLAAGRIQLDGLLRARRFNAWARSLAVEPQGGNLLRRTQVLHLKDMDAEIPLSQQVLVKLPRVELPPPRRSIFESGAASALYGALQPYTGSRSRLRIAGITLDQQSTATSREGYFLSTLSHRYTVDRVALDLAIADSTLRLSRLYVKLFGGDVAGEVQAQLVKLRPLDVRLILRTQVTGVNLARLDPHANEHTAKTEVSALVDLRYWLSRQFVEGRVDITRLSLDMLDSLLAYLDPTNTNESVKSNRKLINAWYTKWINPKVKLVSVWISHGNLNMDIDMDAWFVAGTIIKRTLKNMRIRRINIVPFLPKGAGTEEE